MPPPGAGASSNVATPSKYSSAKRRGGARSTILASNATPFGNAKRIAPFASTAESAQNERRP